MSRTPESKHIVFHGKIKPGVYTLQPTNGLIIQSEKFSYMQVIHCDSAPTLSIKIVNALGALTVRVPYADTAEEESELDALIAMLCTARDQIRREQGL